MFGGLSRLLPKRLNESMRHSLLASIIWGRAIEPNAYLTPRELKHAAQGSSGDLEIDRRKPLDQRTR